MSWLVIILILHSRILFSPLRVIAASSQVIKIQCRKGLSDPFLLHAMEPGQIKTWSEAYNLGLVAVEVSYVNGLVKGFP